MAVLAALDAGDALAFARVSDVVMGHLARLRAYQLRESWQDLVQEVVISLLRAFRRGALRDPRAFISYAGTVTRNKLHDWIEAQRRPGGADPLGEPERAADALDPSQRPAQRSPDLLLDLERSLAGLPEKQRRVVEAIYLHGHTYQEAADLLQLPLGTVNRLQHEALSALRERMGLSP